MSLEFRALLEDPGDLSRERPLQIYASHMSVVRTWATTVLKKAVSPDACVIVMEAVEQLRERIRKPPEEEAAPPEAQGQQETA